MILRIEGITKTFGGLVAVDNVTFEVTKGQIFSVIGPNGAGKTTLFNVINGFYLPKKGHVYFKGVNITGLRPHVVCKKGIARSFQVVKPLARLSVLDNVIVGAYNRVNSLPEARDMAEKELEYVGLAEHRHKEARSLTLAYRKRMEMARALATQPDIIMLDECVAGLNPTEIDKVVEIIRRIREERGVTFLVIEHVMRVIMSVSDRIAVLHHGAKIAEGGPEEVSVDPEVISAYLGEANA